MIILKNINKFKEKRYNIEERRHFVLWFSKFTYTKYCYFQINICILILIGIDILCLQIVDNFISLKI